MTAESGNLRWQVGAHRAPLQRPVKADSIYEMSLAIADRTGPGADTFRWRKRRLAVAQAGYQDCRGNDERGANHSLRNLFWCFSNF